MSDKPGQQRLFFILLVIVAVSSFYSVYLFKRSLVRSSYTVRPVSFGITQEPFPEHAEQMNEIYNLVAKEGRVEEGKSKFRMLAEEIHGGEDWVLLKLSLLDNRQKTYQPLAAADKPQIEITADRSDTGNISITVKITNRDSELIHLPKVPSEVHWNLRGPGTGNKDTEIKGDASLFGDPEAEDVINLRKNAFWGITIPLDPGGMKMIPGEWSISLTLVYGQNQIQGLNVVNGKFDSNEEKVIL